MNIKQTIKGNLINIPGFKTHRKLIVIESDDWGSIRMPSIKTLDKLLKRGIRFCLDMGYDKIDTIASKNDLENLFEVLHSVKDKNNNPAVITANSLVTNPDFDKIKASGFTEYHYELITDTMNKYYSQANPFVLWQQGIKERIFHPQFHGREHLNSQLWLEILKQNLEGARDAFDESIFCQVSDIPSDNRLHVLSAYDYKYEKERMFIEKSIKEGMEIFEQLFRYRSLSAIAPCFVWDDFIEQCYFNQGIKYIQGSIFQTYSTYQKQKSDKKGKYHYMGQTNNLGQKYLVRNCFFEPSQNPIFNYVDDCLHRIKFAFRWKKPAIISAHRLNFIGTLDIRNRDENLKQFSTLLKEIIRQWPDVEFMTSDVLGELMNKNSVK